MTSNAASSVADGGLVAVAGSSARPVEGSAAGCVARSVAGCVARFVAGSRWLLVLPVLLNTDPILGYSII